MDDVSQMNHRYVFVLNCVVIHVSATGCPRPKACLKTGFARDSGHKQTFSKLPKVIQVQWKLQKQKDLYILINGSFNQNRQSMRSNILGGFGHNANGCQ